MQAFRQLDAVAAPLPRINVDTDQILPARYLQKLREAPFGDYLFRDARHDATGARRADFAPNGPAYATAQILVARRNFGCGSSREHAVWALVDGGFRAVVAPSFGDIFFSNALKNGLLPVRLPEAVVDALLEQLARAPGTRLQVDLEQLQVRGPTGDFRFELDPFARHCLLNGLDEIDYTLAQMARIEAFERALDPGLEDGKVIA